MGHGVRHPAELFTKKLQQGRARRLRRGAAGLEEDPGSVFRQLDAQALLGHFDLDMFGKHGHGGHFTDFLVDRPGWCLQAVRRRSIAWLGDMIRGLRVWAPSPGIVELRNSREKGP